MNSSIRLKPYTSLELARMYEVSDKTFKKWLRPFEDSVGPKNGYFYTIAQVKIIFEKLGMPGKMAEE